MNNQNTVKYTILCKPSVTNLKDTCVECQSFCNALTKDYIWQNESFLLNPTTTVTHPCLTGSTDYGENLNDEWFIVYILFQLSKHCNDIVIQVSDEDGEFLLIQAANVLPSWLKPEVSVNRIFIHCGNLHIIPQPTNPGEMGVYPMSTPSLAQAYDLVISDAGTVASEAIQMAIQKKVEAYPDKVEQDFHNAHCYVPVELAYILHEHPGFIAKAVQAFYERDPVDVNICSRMKHFPPNNCVITPVKFTRHLYGQLHQAKFFPNTKSKWKLPPQSDKLHKTMYLGYKLTCGFEIILARSLPGNLDSNTEPCGRKWDDYLLNLKNNDFFRGELEGSKKYTELLTTAKEHFRASFIHSPKTDDIGHLISELASEAKKHTEEIREWCQNIPEEDSDDWLILTPAQLDEMLLNEWKHDNRPINNKPCSTSHRPNEAMDIGNLSKMASSVKSFVDKVSSYEGAELSSNCRHTNKYYNENDDIDFDPNVFMDCVKNLLHSDGSENINNSGRCESDDSDDYDSDVDDDFVSCFKDRQFENELSDMMEMMDSELKGSNVTKSFQNAKTSRDPGTINNDASCDLEAPLDLDYNVIENFLESFAGQEGHPGPVSTLMSNFGINLPPDDGDV